MKGWRMEWTLGLALLWAGVGGAWGQGALIQPVTTRPAAGESFVGGTEAAGGGPLHVVSMARDGTGNVWVGSEGQGIWKWDGKGWTTFGKGVTGDQFAYAVACDQQGRVWVGTATHGVSVFNGQQWQTYNTWGPRVGPVGQHVTVLAVNPKDGGVWMGTDAGVSCYTAGSGNKWVLYGRATGGGGLPADQVRGIAFEGNGDVYLATACDGVVIGRAGGDGKYAWEQVKGPERVGGVEPVPLVWEGKGLPSWETNCVAADGKGHVYVGTPLGLAVSGDAGKTWRFWRGKDWAAEAHGSYGGAPAGWTPGKEGLMSEDWVTCLMIDGEGMLWVGHRTTGYERINPETGEVMAAGNAPLTGGDGKALPSFVRGLAIDGEGKVLVGRYLSGVTECASPTVKAMATPVLNEALQRGVPPLPAPAAAPTVAELQGWEKEIANLPARGKGDGAENFGGYIGEDWVTGGDWVGHIGRQMAKLGAWNLYEVDGVYTASLAAGGHWGTSGPYSYTHAVDVQSQRAMIAPFDGRRAETELNDGSFSDDLASTAIEGPDLWVKVNIPDAEGAAHRISVYMMNPDGQTGRNALRDFVLELRRDDRESAAEGARDLSNAQDLSAEERIALEKLPVVARGRASGTWNGVYEEFVVNRPGLYWVKVVRNHSFVAKCFGVFVDRMGKDSEKATHGNWVDAEIDPPDADLSVGGATERETEARKLWSAAEDAWGRPGAERVVHAAEMAAYRAGEAEQIDPDVLTLWRWKIGLWGVPDREAFDQGIAAGVEKLRSLNR